MALAQTTQREVAVVASPAAPLATGAVVGTEQAGYPMPLTDSTSAGTAPAIPTCGTCLHRTTQDVCCTLTGETRHSSDAGCGQWTDGKCAARVECAEPDCGQLAAGPDGLCAYHDNAHDTLCDEVLHALPVDRADGEDWPEWRRGRDDGRAR